MPLTVPFRTRHEMATSLQKHAEPEYGKLNLLAYNFHVSDSPIYWLVPSSQNPAFSDSKFVLWDDFDAQGRIHVGIHAEKGFGPKYSKANPTARGKGKVMDETWYWNRFCAFYDSGLILQAMAHAAQLTVSPIYLRINTYYKSERPAIELDGMALGMDTAVYRLDPGNAGLVLDRESKTELGLLKSSETEDPESIPNVLKRLTEEDWAWVDFLVTTPFSPGDQSDAAWSGRRVWKEYLSTFSFAVGSMHLR